MSDISNGSRRRALFISSSFPYPNSHGLPLRQSTQIEALAFDYDVTVAVLTLPFAIHSAEIVEGVNVRVESLTGRTAAVRTASKHLGSNDLRSLPRSHWNATPLESLHKIYLGELFDLLIFAKDAITDPVRPEMRQSCRADYQRFMQTNRFDIVWVSRLETAWALGPIGEVASVLDLDDLESHSYKSKHALKGRMKRTDALNIHRRTAEISHAEREASCGYNLITLAAASEAEKGAFPNARILPNCSPSNPQPRSTQPGDSLRLLFVGLMEYLPNAHGLCWFLREVWPRLQSILPAASLDVVGECFDVHRHPNLVCPGNVRVHGYVADASAFWNNAALLIVPVFAGGGTRIKILEAWSRGVPVVSTSMGIAGLDAADGIHALIANTPEEFADQCRALLSSPELRQSLAAAGLALVRSRFSRDCAMASVRRIAGDVFAVACAEGQSAP